MKNNALIGICLFLFFFILGATYLARDDIRDYLIGTLKPDTVYEERIEWKHDSFEIEKPIPKYIYKVKVDTVYDKEDNPLELITENKKYQLDTVCVGDTLTVTSYISGINANLDSLRVKLSKQEIIKTEIITKYIERPKTLKDHFKVRPSITTGYDLVNKEFGVMGGISLVFDF